MYLLLRSLRRAAARRRDKTAGAGRCARRCPWLFAGIKDSTPGMAVSSEGAMGRGRSRRAENPPPGLTFALDFAESGGYNKRKAHSAKALTRTQAPEHQHKRRPPPVFVVSNRRAASGPAGSPGRLPPRSAGANPRRARPVTAADEARRPVCVLKGPRADRVEPWDTAKKLRVSPRWQPYFGGGVGRFCFEGRVGSGMGRPLAGSIGAPFWLPHRVKRRIQRCCR